MQNKINGKFLKKTGIILIVAICFGLACSASLLAATSVKQSSTQPASKADPIEWKNVVEAAKKEGKIVMSGPPGENWRTTLVDMFQQEYPEITVELTAGPGRNFLPRIRQERKLGKKLWDFRVGGTDTVIEAKRNGFLAPIRPLLLPEIADDSKWIGGLDGLFIFPDREKKYIFAFNLYLLSVAYVNRDLIKESDLKSISQFLDPKFRGKIVMLTPTGGASQKSLGYMAFMYGENFIRELLSKQDVAITDDNRQQAEWVVRGKYPIAVGFVPPLLVPFQKQGLGKNVMAMALEETVIPTTTGSGSISLLEGAPHPNAAKVYFN